MADAKVKKPVAKKEEVKAAAPVKEAAPVKVEAPVKKAEPAKKEEVKAAAPAKKEAPAKAAPEKKAAAPAKKPAAKKAEVKSTITLELDAERKYTNDDLMKILNDVWKYDLKKKVADIKTVEMYVKPYTASVYYKVNGEVEGEFSI